MGMDVYGDNPSSEVGEYFRSNVWWWRPLADYCQAVAPDACSGCEYWHTNDGDGLDATAAARLAVALREELRTGRTSVYASAYTTSLASLPRQECEFCDGTGTRQDAVGVSLNMHRKVIEHPPNHLRIGQTGWCNGCDGTGSTKSITASYPFGVDFVEDFAEFVANSGGFKIW